LKHFVWFIVITICLIHLPIQTVYGQVCTPYHEIVAGYDATLVIHYLETDTMVTVNPQRAAERRPPFSTFKVFNALVALEVGTFPDVNTQLPYDPTMYPLEGIPNTYPFDQWRQEQDLRTAMRYSVVWFFIETARVTGQAQMQDYLDELPYGNADASAWLADTPFWLGNGLEISTYEQVDFLRRLVEDDLPLFSDTTTAAVREILILDEQPDYDLSGKTGTDLSGGLAWFVGYIRQTNSTTVFALNVEQGQTVRDQITEAVVHHITNCK